MRSHVTPVGHVGRRRDSKDNYKLAEKKYVQYMVNSCTETDDGTAINQKRVRRPPGDIPPVRMSQLFSQENRPGMCGDVKAQLNNTFLHHHHGLRAV
ncbi:uncharacterized protein PAE49_012780 isoform 3-T3 [Odontesthes bonariensis]